MAVVKLRDGTVLSCKYRLLDYNNWRLISIKELKRRMNDEINRVWGLKSDKHVQMGWCDPKAKQNEYWEDDHIKFLPRVGKPRSLTHKHLTEARMYIISYLSKVSPDNLTHFRGIQSLHASISTAKPGTPSDPLRDRPPSDRWSIREQVQRLIKTQLRLGTAFVSFRPISDLRKYMMEECVAIMRDTFHEDKCFLITMRCLY